MPLVVSNALFLLVSPSLVIVGSGLSEQFLGRVFRLVMAVEKAAVGRARRSAKGRHRTCDEQTDRGGGG